VSSLPVLTTDRLRLQIFSEADIPALADILAEPDVAKNIVANGSSPERCRAAAAYRIRWHNSAWDKHGYGVWAVKSGAGALLGWCGFAEPDIEGHDPEILYGFGPQHWGQGFAQEAARGAIDWLFRETGEAGVSAIIFGKLNPVSVALTAKFGMTKRGTMAMAEFLTDPKRAQDIVDYELWRLAEGTTRDPVALLFQAPFKGGQFSTLYAGDKDAIAQAFCDAARRRADFTSMNAAERDRHVRAAFQQGVAEPSLDWYHVARAAWRQGA
jgi:RimJ/RimL family protein N-acetyltransferase